jgi:subtilase family serine protease
VIAHVDPLKAVAEAIESNNTTRSSTVRVGPDLTVYSLSIPSSVKAGQSFTATSTTRNTGGGHAAASTTVFYLSTNTSLDSSDVMIGSQAVPPLDPDGNFPATATLTVPPGLAPATYYLLGVADALDEVPETSETNNIKRPTIKVLAP